MVTVLPPNGDNLQLHVVTFAIRPQGTRPVAYLRACRTAPCHHRANASPPSLSATAAAAGCTRLRVGEAWSGGAAPGLPIESADWRLSLVG